MEAAPESAQRGLRPGAAVALAAAAGLLFAAVFLGGDSGDGSVFWLGAAALVLAAAAAVAAARGPLTLPRLDRAGGAAVTALVGLVAWVGLSIAWSVAAERSWAAFDKGLAYVSFFALGIALAGATGALAARSVAALLAAVLGLALAWALLGKAIPGLFPDGGRAARLRSPVGYWNGLALLADASLALGLWLLSTRPVRPLVRGGGALLLHTAVLALLLTSSRAGILAGLAAVGLWLALDRDRVQTALAGLAAALPAGLVAGWAYTRPALVEDGQARADRVADGALFGLLALAGAALAAGVVLVLVPAALPPQRRRALGRALVAATAAGAAALVAAGAVAVGNPVAWAGDQFSGGECTNDPSRLTTLCPNNRGEWWGEAWQIFEQRPLAGAGAGTFELARKRFREDATSVTQPHSVPLQLLAGTGAVGLALLAAFAAALGVAIAAALRRLRDGERRAAAAIAAFPLVYALHALVDYDLDFLAVTAPMLLASGVLLGAARPARPRPGAWTAAAAVALALAAGVALAFPWLAERRLESGTSAYFEGRLERAAAEARSAQALNPLSPEPRWLRAAVAERAGALEAALVHYRGVAELQPENPETWYRLGLFQYLVLRESCAAYQSLNRSYTLDPKGRQWTRGGPLDRARDDVNAGACEP